MDDVRAPPELRAALLQVSQGVEHLHSLRIVHRFVWQVVAYIPVRERGEGEGGGRTGEGGGRATRILVSARTKGPGRREVQPSFGEICVFCTAVETAEQKLNRSFCRSPSEGSRRLLNFSGGVAVVIPPWVALAYRKFCTHTSGFG